MHSRPPMRIVAAAALAATMLGLVGCASTPSSSGGAASNTAALPGKPGCFWLRNFDGSWTVLKNDELIVYAPLYRNPYLIKLFEPVLNLKFDQRLGFLDIERTGMICNDAYDDVVVPNWQPHNVPIVAVHQLTVAQADELLRANGIKAPPQHASKARDNGNNSGNNSAAPPQGNPGQAGSQAR